MTYESKEREILDQVVAALHGHYGERLSRVVLFGSRARRDHASDSDFDVLVVLKGDFDQTTERKVVGDLIYPIDCEHWVVVYCHLVTEKRYLEDQTAFMKNVRAEGVVLWNCPNPLSASDATARSADAQPGPKGRRPLAGGNAPGSGEARCAAKAAPGDVRKISSVAAAAHSALARDPGALPPASGRRAFTPRTRGSRTLGTPTLRRRTLDAPRERRGESGKYWGLGERQFGERRESADARSAASKDVFLVVFDPVLLEERDVFLLERAHAVMLLLPVDVFFHRIQRGDTDAENGVSVLPIERAVSDVVVGPFRTAALDVADNLRGRVNGFEAHQNVDVVAHATDGERLCADGVQAAADVGVEALLPFGEDESLAVFGGEDEVGVESGEGGTHRLGILAEHSSQTSCASGAAFAAQRASRDPGALPPASGLRPFGPGNCSAMSIEAMIAGLVSGDVDATCQFSTN